MTENANFFGSHTKPEPRHPDRDLDAEHLGDDITHVLGHSWFFDPQTIRVSLTGGRVSLTGRVRSERERRMAAAAAWAHEGVTDVDNRLLVDQPSPI